MAVARQRRTREVQTVITEDASNTRETLARLETDIRSITTGFSTYRDDVQRLTVQQGHQERQMNAMTVDFKTDLATLTSSFRSDMDKVSTQMGMIVDKIEGKRIGTGGWALIAGTALGFMVAAASIILFMNNAQITTAMNPVNQFIAQNAHLGDIVHAIEMSAANSHSADIQSQVDRSELNRRMGRAEDGLVTEVTQRKEESAMATASRVEIETQFKNLTGQVYYLWHKVTGDSYPLVSRETINR